MIEALWTGAAGRSTAGGQPQRPLPALLTLPETPVDSTPTTKLKHGVSDPPACNRCGAHRRGPAHKSGRAHRGDVVVPASEATREAMCTIHASIEAHRATIEDTAEAGDVGTLQRERPPKQVRTEPTVGTQPANAVADTRDGRTKIYVAGFEFTRATITSVKITYRCSFYRSQECPAKLVFYASMMDYDFPNMVSHTCTPPSRANPPLDAGTGTLVIKAAMQRQVDHLAPSTSSTPQEI